MEIRTLPTEPAPKRAARAGAGRKRGPRPYFASVRTIINATERDMLTGVDLPVAALDQVEIPGGDVAYARWYRRTRRQLTEAGKLLAAEDGVSEPYLIGMDVRVGGMGSKSIVPVYELRFWHRNQKSN